MSPFGWTTERSRTPLLLVLSGLLVVLSLALTEIGAPLATPEAPWGILSYEFAGSAEGAARILGSWSAAAREQAMLSLGLDYLYLLVYPAWFALACWAIAGRLEGGFAALGRGVAWAVLPAGGLDAVENHALIRMLQHGPDDTWAGIAWLCAGVKFGLVILALAYLPAGGAALAWQRRRR